MRALAPLLVFVTASMLAACSGRSPWQQDPAVIAAQADLLKAQAEAARSPAERFQVAGKREYVNGTEVYVLDGQSGQICYYFIASGRGDNDAQKTDLRSCAGLPLVPQL